MSAASPNPLLVFDLDGTLAETAGDLVRSLNFIMDRVGLAPVSLAEGRQFVGQGARMMIQAGFRQAGRTVEGGGGVWVRWALMTAMGLVLGKSVVPVRSW